MSKVILKGFIIVPCEDLKAVQAELPIHIENTKKEKGCSRFYKIKSNQTGLKFTKSSLIKSRLKPTSIVLKTRSGVEFRQISKGTTMLIKLDSCRSMGSI